MKIVLPSTRYFPFSRNRAQAVLSLVLLIGGIVVLIGLTLAFLATSFVNSSYGYKIAQQAQAVAMSGAEDALMQLARNKDFSSSGYTLTVGSNSATVTVTQDSPVTGQVTITSTATVTFRQRSVRVVVSRDPNTGQIVVLSWTSVVPVAVAPPPPPPSPTPPPSGALGSWLTTTVMPGYVYNHSAMVNNGYIYVIGGNNGIAATSTVSFAPINSTGSIGAWTNTTALPSALFRHSTVVNNGYIYAVGGGVGANGATSTVSFAPINSTGSIGAWTNTSALPAAILQFSAVVNSTYIYAMGGSADTTTSTATSTVSFAPINSTGSIGAWTNTTALPSAVLAHSAVVNNGYIYVTGGIVSSGSTSTVSFAPINSTGSIGAWTNTTALPSVIRSHSGVVNNGYVYVTGGKNDTSVTSTVLFAPFQ